MHDSVIPFTSYHMKMPTLSVRIPSDTNIRLAQAAKRTHRSRSFLVKEALERHLIELE